MSKPDFSNLKKAEMDGENPRPYRITVLEDAPTLWFLPATNANKDFLNETLRRSNERAPGQGRRPTSEGSIEEAREEDRQVLASACVKRWDVRDASGKEVECSAENVLEYFRALPDWIFDGIRGWAANPVNFMQGSAPALGEH